MYDSVPIKHLMSKNKSLLKSPKRIMSVLVKNSDPIELEMGTGNFRHIQFQRINQTKLEIKFDITDDLSCFSKIKIKKI